MTKYLTRAALYKAVSDMLFEEGPEVEMQHASAYNLQSGWSKADGIYLTYSYRWKPAPKRMVKIGYLDSNGNWQQKELAAPETEAPAMNTPIYLLGNPVHRNYNVAYREALDSGCVFLTREDAQAMSDWLTKCRLEKS